MKKTCTIFRLMLFFGLVLFLFDNCQSIAKKTEQNANQLSQDTLNKIANEVNSNSELNNIPQDSMFALLQGSYYFDKNIKELLPNKTIEYFKKVDFSYFLPDSFTIDYSCKRKPFKLTDFYIFNKLNKYRGCEYIALVDTNKFIQVIAQQCADMENWISLYVFDNNYKIIGFDLLLLNGGGDNDDIKPLIFKGVRIKCIGYISSLKYVKGLYKVFRNQIYLISDAEGKEMEDVGLQEVRYLKVNDYGKIVIHDTITIKKDYVDLYNSMIK